MALSRSLWTTDQTLPSRSFSRASCTQEIHRHRRGGELCRPDAAAQGAGCVLHPGFLLHPHNPVILADHVSAPRPPPPGSPARYTALLSLPAWPLLRHPTAPPGGRGDCPRGAVGRGSHRQRDGAHALSRGLGEATACFPREPGVSGGRDIQSKRALTVSWEPSPAELGLPRCKRRLRAWGRVVTQQGCGRRGPMHQLPVAVASPPPPMLCPRSATRLPKCLGQLGPPVWRADADPTTGKDTRQRVFENCRPPANPVALRKRLALCES